MIILVLILFFNSTTPCAYAEFSKTYYAQILFDSVYLYKTPTNDSVANIYFELPKTYFVELLDNATQDFYLVRYINIKGYVKKESVQAVEKIPVTPFLDNINFRVYADLSRGLYSEPNASSSTSSLVANIPLYSRNLTFYGKIIGENLIEGRTDIWYYCKYTADKDYYGYVYSDFCDELPNPTPTNSEEVSYITNPTFEEEINQNANHIELNSGTNAIITAIITIPALIFIFMIIKNKNVLKKEHVKEKEIKEY